MISQKMVAAHSSSSSASAEWICCLDKRYKLIHLQQSFIPRYTYTHFIRKSLEPHVNWDWWRIEMPLFKIQVTLDFRFIALTHSLTHSRVGLCLWWVQMYCTRVVCVGLFLSPGGGGHQCCSACVTADSWRERDRTSLKSQNHPKWTFSYLLCWYSVSKFRIMHFNNGLYYTMKVNWGLETATSVIN